MNKKANVLIYAIMLGITIIILGLALAPVVFEFTNDARNVSTDNSVGLNCDNSTISNFDKAACVATDLSAFYVVAAVILIGGGIVTAKFLGVV